jgi:UDP-N-acetylglucosamine--N-acetylmuramyl-(pentapeptide) pyrophosphoryl-undecaprenol N-acetylglucosamine transferase
MTIVVTGGGSGGHITPILAVAHELKQLQPDTKIVYIGQKGDPFADIPRRDPNIDEVYTVSAGKFRRYYGEGLKQLLDFKTMYLNLRDVFRILVGFFQSRRLMRKLKPAIVFSRGGYVSVPVSLGAHTRGIPFITHDSDSIPSLANRLIAPWAAKNAVALPKEIYPYNQTKAVTVGVPVRAEYDYVTPAHKDNMRKELSYAPEDSVVFVIGGGLGAQNINDAFVGTVADMFKQVPSLRLLHVAGEKHEAALKDAYKAALTPEQASRVTVFGYLDDVYRYSAAADVVVTRAGASSLADFAVQGKACIVIPSPFLVAGHQLKNAGYLHEQGAIELVDELALKDNPALLVDALVDLLKDASKRQKLGDTFKKYGNREAALDLAKLIITEANVKA